MTAPDGGMKDVDMEYLIKMEVCSDGEDIHEACLETTDDDNIDPLLILKPIVYTTKLDDMHVVNQDLRKFNPKEINNMIISESKPKVTAKILETPSNTENIQSYIKLVSVIQQLNLKSKMHVHSAYVKNLKLWSQCQPFSIVLEDIKHTILANKKVEALNHVSNISQTASATNLPCFGVGDVQVKIEAVVEQCVFDNETNEVQVKKEAAEEQCFFDGETNDVHVPNKNAEKQCFSNGETNDDQVKKKVDVPWAGIKTVTRHVAIESIDISNSETNESDEALPRSEAAENSQISILRRLSPAKTAKSIELQNKKVETVSSDNRREAIVDLTKSTKVPPSQKPETKKRPRTRISESSDEENTASIKYKRKPVAAATTLQPRDTLSAYKNYTLIVLIYKREQAYVYRVNSIKLISDYFIITAFKDVKLVAMYPKEEKITENYCCWLKREEAIKKVCTRKSYPFTIQKFMRQPHNCIPGDCKCCCFTNNSDSKRSKISQEPNVNRPAAVAKGWLRGLLERNQSSTSSLIRKALNYIPKVQVKEKVIAKEPETYLEFAILWMKCTRLNDCFNNVPELYEIGKNGDVVRSFIIDDSDKCHRIRRTYQLMGLETLKMEFCCWYTRDKLLMTKLRMAEVSPTALKSIQVSHVCEKNNCECCCKPQIKPLKDFETLPANIKHTSAYEKSPRPFSIRFNVRSYVANKIVGQYNTKSSQSQTKTYTSTAIISSPAEKRDKGVNDLSATILSQCQNLNLGINSEGKLEVILKAPARYLSVAELKVLSDRIAFLTKQITKLKISPQELCDTINSKSDQINDDVAPEVSQISEPDNELHDDSVGVIIAPAEIITSSSFELTKKPHSPATLVTTPNTDSSKKGSHILYTSMADSLEMQNKSYIDSFQSFYNHFASSNNMVLETTELPPAVNALRENASTQPCAIPKIVETYTLAKSSLLMPVFDADGPSDSTLQAQFSKTEHEGPVVPSVSSWSSNVVSAASLKTSNTRSSTKTCKRKEPFDYTPINKKFRVISASKLIDQKTNVPATKVTQTNPAPKWPTPILIKREPDSNTQTIVHFSQSVPTQIKPNLQSTGYIIGNKVVPASNAIVSTTTLNNVYQVKRSGIVTTAAGNANRSNAGVRVLTLSPVTKTQSNCTTGKKTMLAQILKKPQEMPFRVTSGPRVPPLVPIRLKIGNKASRQNPHETVPTRELN